MSDIKLVYFNVKGRAETARLVLAYAGVQYEDKRIEGAEMAALKPTLPFGQLPVLEYKGTTICQSMTIARFLANEFGLAGDTPIEKAQVDEVVDSISDFQNALYATHFEKDEKLKEEKQKKVMEETIPNTLSNLEKILQKRGGQYFVGNKVTWAEMHFYQIMEIVLGQNSGALDAFPKLKSLNERIKLIPNIKKWLEERPATDF